MLRRFNKYIAESSLFLAQMPEHGVVFTDDSLSGRLLLAGLIDPRRPEESPESFAVLFEMIFALFTPERMVGDHEFCWRAQFLLAAVLFREYDTTEWSPTGQGGVFFDSDYIENVPAWVVPEDLLRELISANLPALPGESFEHHVARYNQSLCLAAARGMLRARIACLAPAGYSAQMHQLYAHYVFKILIATSAYLEDWEAVLRGISLARRLNIVVGVATWSADRSEPRMLLGRMLPNDGADEPTFEPSVAADRPTDAADRPSEPADERPDARVDLRDTLILEYFIYETGGDNLIRCATEPRFTEGDADRVRGDNHYLAPHEVAALVQIGRQWEDPTAYKKLSSMSQEELDRSHISLQNVLLNAVAAGRDVPSEGYEEWLGNALFGVEISALIKSSSRLVVLPYNYLHNFPFHLLSPIRDQIESGALREIVVAPQLELMWRLLDRRPAERERCSCLFVGVNSDEIDADAEYETVRRSFPGADALIDERAQGITCWLQSRATTSSTLPVTEATR